MERAATILRSWASRVLFSPSERRLRAGWRLAIQSLLLLIFALAAGCGVMAAWPGALSAGQHLGTAGGLLLTELVQVAIITLSVFLARRLLDRRTFVSLGLLISRRAARDLGAGVAIAFIIMGMVYIAQWKLGWLRLDGFAWQIDPAQTVILNSCLYLGIFLLVGWSEELLSRGYDLQTIASGTNLLWGVFLSSAIFGALHLGNPHASWIGAVGIFFAGLLLGYGFVRSGQLWLSIGLHIGWNFFEGVIFGFPVSGLSVYHLTRISVSGPELWTGGAFGPEAGILVLPAIALGVGLIHLYTAPSVRE